MGASKSPMPLPPPPTHPDMWNTRRKRDQEKPQDDGDFRSKTPREFLNGKEK